MQYLKAIATVDGCGLVFVGATSGVLCAMPLVTIASRSGVLYRIAVVERQVEGDNAITTISSGC